MIKPMTLALAFTSFASLADNCGSYGCPTGGVASNQVIERPIYTLSNNAETKFADWVAYSVRVENMHGPKRSRNWRADPNLPENATLERDDYKYAHATIGTDRGHQVPLASFSNTPHYYMTNFLSNITPQASNLNQGPWVRLENNVRAVANTGTPAYVVTGPLYEYEFAQLPNADESHYVPSGYFKVVATIANDGSVKASAYVMEQTSGRRDNFCQKEVTIDEVEYRTGLNLFPNLPANQEADVEGRVGGLSSALGCQ
ncbi:MAG: DNA/RNA non-specific endonuclease [Parashewanella sp.]